LGLWSRRTKDKIIFMQLPDDFTKEDFEILRNWLKDNKPKGFTVLMSTGWHAFSKDELVGLIEKAKKEVEKSDSN
jgi:hypothetical protein